MLGFLPRSWVLNLNTIRYVITMLPELELVTYLMQSEEVPESVPKNLYLTAAILIREGFINLEDLYLHVSSFLCILLDLNLCFVSCTPSTRTWRIIVKIMSRMFTLVLPGP